MKRKTAIDVERLVECPYCDQQQHVTATKTEPYIEPVRCLYCDAPFLVEYSIEIIVETSIRKVDGAAEESKAYRSRRKK